MTSTGISLRLGFAGTPAFAAESLAAVLTSAHQLCAVYTQPDRPAGRGRRLTASPVKQLAEQNAVRVWQPGSLNEPGVAEQMSALNLDVLVVVAYGLLLPQTILALPRAGCVNVHASLLPRWRGAAPIERALLAGDDQTGISIMQMEPGLDTGPVLQQVTCPIAADDTAGTLHDRLAALGASSLLDALEQIANGTSKPVPQDDTLATYAKKISKADTVLDWHEPAAKLAQKIRAFNPRTGCSAQLQETAIKIWLARASADQPEGAPGTIVPGQDQAIGVATGDGVLQLLEVQFPGKKRISAAQALNARPDWA